MTVYVHPKETPAERAQWYLEHAEDLEQFVATHPNHPDCASWSKTAERFRFFVGELIWPIT